MKADFGTNDPNHDGGQTMTAVGTTDAPQPLGEESTLEGGTALSQQAEESEYHIHPKFKNLLPPKTSEKYRALKEAICSEGIIRNPLVVWKEKKILLDGHNRAKIGNELGIKPPIQEKSFTSWDDAIMWVLKNQLEEHRNMNTFERIELALKSKSIYVERAKANQLGGVLLTSTKGIVVVEEIAKLASTSTDAVKKVEKILAKASEPDVAMAIDALRRGDAGIYINGVYQDFCVEEKNTSSTSSKKSNPNPASRKRGSASGTKPASVALPADTSVPTNPTDEGSKVGEESTDTPESPVPVEDEVASVEDTIEPTEPKQDTLISRIKSIKTTCKTLHDEVSALTADFESAQDTTEWRHHMVQAVIRSFLDDFRSIASLLKVFDEEDTTNDADTKTESKGSAFCQIGVIHAGLERIKGEVKSAQESFCKENLQQNNHNGIILLLQESQVLCGGIKGELVKFGVTVSNGSDSGDTCLMSETVVEHCSSSIEANEAAGCDGDDSTSDNETQTTSDYSCLQGSHADKPFFIAEGDGYKAEGILNDDGIGLTVRTDSTIRQIEEDAMSERVKVLRAELEKSGVINGVTFVQDHTFKSHSEAASVIYGTNVHGKKSWKGLKEFIDGGAK